MHISPSARTMRACRRDTPSSCNRRSASAARPITTSDRSMRNMRPRLSPAKTIRWARSRRALLGGTTTSPNLRAVIVPVVGWLRHRSPSQRHRCREGPEDRAGKQARQSLTTVEPDRPSILGQYRRGGHSPTYMVRPFNRSSSRGPTIIPTHAVRPPDLAVCRARDRFESRRAARSRACRPAYSGSETRSRLARPVAARRAPDDRRVAWMTSTAPVATVGSSCPRSRTSIGAGGGSSRPPSGSTMTSTSAGQPSISLTGTRTGSGCSRCWRT